MGICIIYLMIVLIAFGVFELKNNKVCFKYEFMDKQFTYHDCRKLHSIK